MVIDRPIEHLWSLIDDLPFLAPRARELTLALRKTSPGLIGLGTTFTMRLSILGFEVTTGGRVMEWDPPRGAALSLTDGVFRSGTLRFAAEPVGQGTRLTRVLELEPRGVLRLFWPLVAPYVDRRSARGFRNLKQLLETSVPERRA